MVDVIGRAKVIITGDVDSSSIQKSGGKIGSALKAGALVGVAALGTLGVAGVKAVQAFQEGEAQTRKLTQVLDNMGKSSAADSLDDLASSLQRTTGVSDDTIKSGETLLATFSEVAKSAGEVGGTFERATRAAVDMSAAGFGSVESASVMLGKALQDPLKGVSALGRAGVTFTAQQKELIKSLVDTGETGKAQALILAEVEKQVKGTGEASATETDKIKQSFGELEESAGHLIVALAGDGKGKKGGGLSGAIFNLSDQLDETADSKSWGKLGKDTRDTSGDIFDLTGKLASADKGMGKIILRAPGFGDALTDLIDPTHGVIKVVLSLVDALKKLDDAFFDVDQVQFKDYTTDSGDLFNLLGGNAGNATGGRSISSGWSWVGEEGPERIYVPSGSDIYSTSESKQMAPAGGGSTQNYYITGPVSLAELRQRAAWYDTYGTRFG